MKWDPNSRRITIDWSIYKLPAGARAPKALIRALCQLADTCLIEWEAPLQPILTAAARWEGLLQWEMNAIHDADMLCHMVGNVVRTIRRATDSTWNMTLRGPGTVTVSSRQELGRCREMLLARVNFARTIMRHRKAMRLQMWSSFSLVLDGFYQPIFNTDFAPIMQMSFAQLLVASEKLQQSSFDLCGLLRQSATHSRKRWQEELAAIRCFYLRYFG